MAIANDAGGSARLPASWTGVVGLKPSQGLIPCTGLPQFWSPALEVCGLMARTVKDCALLFEVCMEMVIKPVNRKLSWKNCWF